MSARVNVVNSRFEPIDDEVTYYHGLIGVRRRAEFPMLAWIDPLGVTLFNRVQAGVVHREFERIMQMVSLDGPVATAEYLGSDESGAELRIPAWNADEMMVPMLTELERMSDQVIRGAHRFLRFSGA